MTYRAMTEGDIETLARWYAEYHNEFEGCCYTVPLAAKRIHQVFSREDSLCIVAEEGGETVGFVTGNYSQYDDGFVYDLSEVVVRAEHQGKGLGTALMEEIERLAKAQGALLVQFTAVNDERHDRFYDRLGYGNATNNILKCKML